MRGGVPQQRDMRLDQRVRLRRHRLHWPHLQCAWCARRDAGPAVCAAFAPGGHRCCTRLHNSLTHAPHNAECVLDTCPAQAQCAFASNGCGGSTPSCGTCAGPLLCDAARLSCECPDGQTRVGGDCLLTTGTPSEIGTRCASGISAAGACADRCPAGSSLFQGRCRCRTTFYGPTGNAPCTRCGGGSTSKVTGATACVCPSPAAWDAANNVCVCPGTDVYVAGECLKPPGTACGAGKECVSGECRYASGGWLCAHARARVRRQTGSEALHAFLAHVACTKKHANSKTRNLHPQLCH